MTYKVYIQALNGFPIGDYGISAYIGFKDKQTPIVFFEDIEEVPRSKWNIVVADIKDTNTYLESMGMPPKMALNIPMHILDYAGRTIGYNTMGGFRRYITAHPETLPIFIKPNGRSKEFIGGVIKKVEHLDFFKEVSDDKTILISEVVNFVSEYRCYVIDGDIKGIYFYLGNFRVFPDMKVIDECVNTYTQNGAPAGYGIDFGVLDDGRTVLVEVNDGWSLGNYGLEPSKYCHLLGKRWHEMMKAF